MIPYRKFSDIQWGEFRASSPPNPPKAPKVGDADANDARTLDGLGALGAPAADSQNQKRDTAATNAPLFRNPAEGVLAAKAAKPAKDGGQNVPFLGTVNAGQTWPNDRADWSAEDWRARFDERAGFLEHDGGLLRNQAELQAFEHCIVEWLNANPCSSPAGRCTWCGKPETPGAMVLPFGVGERHAWIHAECWPAWHQSRRAEAAIALRSMDIAPGSPLGDHDD
jgi:hypothetical protein